MSYTDGYSTDGMRSEKDAKQRFTEVELWLKKIAQGKSCKKREAWMRDARNGINMYEAGELSDSHDTMQQLSGANLWHANIETIVPALYNSKPMPDVRVRYGDPNKVQQAVCDLTERALSFDLDNYDYDDEMKEVIRQAEISGWGIPRVRYKPTVVNVAIDDATSATGDGEPDGDVSGQGYDQIVKDDVPFECHPWDRFIVGPARSWSKTPWIAFEHDMTLDEIDDLAPPQPDPETGELVLASAKFNPDNSNKDDDGSRKDSDPRPDNPGILNTITVFEVWDKRTKKVWFITEKDKKFPIRVEDDPFDGAIDDFFPVPKVLYAKRRTSSVQPISPWTVYKGLFKEFEDITQRINGLVSQIRVRGLYAKELEADFELLKECNDGEYVPAKDVSQFTAGGKGLDSAIHHWPLQEIIAALKEAVDHRERTKQLIFETTGLSDILRGATNANETLGAQKIKASWGSQRIQDMQQDVAELNRAIIRMKAAIRAKFTPWPLLKEITGMDFAPQMPEPPQPPAASGATGDPQQDAQAAQQAQMQAQQARQAFAMAQQKAIADAKQFEDEVEQSFKSQSRVFRIDIETDSTIRADLSRDQEQMNLFVQSTGTFVQAIAGLVQIMPETRQAMFKLYAAQASKFKLGRQGEAALDELIEAASKPPASGASSDPNQQAHEQQMAQAQQAQQQAQQQHEQTVLQAKSIEADKQRQHDAMTQQTALTQIELKNQGDQQKHTNSIEKMQMERALPPVNGAMASEPPLPMQ